MNLQLVLFYGGGAKLLTVRARTFVIRSPGLLCLNLLCSAVSRLKPLNHVD